MLKVPAGLEAPIHAHTPDYRAVLVELFAEVLDGRNVETTNGVEGALGRPPVDFVDYARRAAAACLQAGFRGSIAGLRRQATD